MLTRFVIIVSLALCAIFFFVAPSRYTADDFRSVIVQEHGLNAAFFGEAHASRVLALLDQFRSTMAGPSVHNESGAAAAHGAPAQFSKSAYGQAMDAMFLLAVYRLSYFLEFLPLFLPFLIVFIIDGFCARSVRAREFVPHSPAMYGSVLFLLVCVCALIVIAFSLPFALHPLVLACCPVIASCLAGIAVGNYHKHV